MSAVQSNKGLFSYRPVKPIDSVIARNILEFLLKFIAYIGFTLAFIWFGYQVSLENIPTIFISEIRSRIWSILIDAPSGSICFTFK